MHKVISALVSIVLIVIFLDREFINGQKIVVPVADDGIDDSKPKAWALTATAENDDVQMPTEDLQHNLDDWNGPEPMRRRRRPGGRKRRRRPHHGQYQINGPESNPYWPSTNTDSYQDQERLMNVQSDKHGSIQQNWYSNKNEFRTEQTNHDSTMYREARPQIQNIKDEDEIQPDIRRPIHNPRNNSYRRPYSQVKKEREQASSNGDSVDLKDLLKQSGGLSLSEILQQKNLSLDDLIKGKQTALRALQNNQAQNDSPTVETPNAMGMNPKTIGLSASIQFSEPSSSTDTSRPNRRLPFAPKSKFIVPTVQSMATTVMTSLDPHLANIMPERNQKITKNHTILYENTTEIPELNTITIANQNQVDLQGNRRLPIAQRVKPIKEIISGIRPDLSNSNTRKRLLPLKLLKNEVKAEITTTMKAITISEKRNIFDLSRPKSIVSTGANLKERLPPRFGNGYRLNSGESADISIVLKNLNQEENVTSTTTATTTTTKQTIQTSPGLIKDIVKTRLALRPRLRLPHIAPNPKETLITSTALNKLAISTSTTTPMPETTTADNIVEETTVFPLSSNNFNSNFNSSPQEMKEIIENSEPEANIIDDTDLKKPSEMPNSILKLSNAIDETSYGDLESNVDEDTTPQPFTAKIGYDEQATEDITKKIDRIYLTENTLITEFDVTEQNPSLFIDITSVKSIDDRTELLDLLEDRRNGARLSKVLAQRNMTLEELIEHRQRGSSQLHLAEIFNKGKPTIPKTRSFVAEPMEIVTAFENFPSFNLNNLKSVKPDEIKTDSQGSSYFTSIINIKPTDEIYKEGKSLQNIFDSVQPFEPSTEQQREYHLPSFRPKINPIQYDGDTMENNFIDVPQDVIVSSSRLSPPPQQESGSYSDVLQIEQEISKSHDLLDLDLINRGLKRNSIQIESAQIPVAIRSVIIASASIICVSVIVFIIIFVTCRWRQNKKKKVNYSENFQAVRSRLPILTRQSSMNYSRRSARQPIVFPPGPRNSKLNTMDPNSPEVQEYLYDAMKHQF